MELTYVTIVVLASMIFVLAGMVGYLYWQQTHMLQHMQSLAMALAAIADQHSPTAEELVEDIHVTKEEDSESEKDDRVSVKEQVEVVDGPPTPTATSADIDEIETKTSAELKDMLTKKGIPFGKRDPKSVLIQLLKATS